MSMDCLKLINELDDFSAESNNGIVTVTIDQAHRKMNVISDGFNEDFAIVADAFITDDNAKGLIITSGKSTFIVGADIDQLAKIDKVEEARVLVDDFKDSLRKLERSGKPVVAAITGTALGGGLETALACHYRIAIDSPKTKLGLPEINLGVLPGGGGTQRMSRLVGIEKAVNLISKAEFLSSQQALEIGLIDAIASNQTDLLNQAKLWIENNTQAKQPWDKSHFSIPHGNTSDPHIKEFLTKALDEASKPSHPNYPAIKHIISSIAEGCAVGIDTGLEIETDYFVKCSLSKESRNMINTMWTQLNKLKKGQSRPRKYGRSRISKVGIIGANSLAPIIAYSIAKSGIKVVLLASSKQDAEQGKRYAENVLDKAIIKGHSNKGKKQKILDMIKATDSYYDLKSCELIIETTDTDPVHKTEFRSNVESVMDKNAIYVFHTSAIPIYKLAEANHHANKTIAIQFLSPADKTPVIEVIKGTQTSDETLAKVFDFVQQIGRTPIVVNDSFAFYVNRILSAYLLEAVAMLNDCISPENIESAAISAGMLKPPLALQDEVSLKTTLNLIQQAKSTNNASVPLFKSHPARHVLEHMLYELNREGKVSSKGFYDYKEDGKKQLWPELATCVSKKSSAINSKQPDEQELINRLLYIQANEAAKCYEEKVISTLSDANVGSILGWGFPAKLGGTLQFINSIGINQFVAHSRELAKKYGKRFEPATVLVKLADTNKELNDVE